MATQLDDALNNIWQMRGVTGIALYSDGRALFRHLPSDVDADDVQIFQSHLNQLISTLTSDGRRPRELYFGYSNAGLLLVVHHGAVLAVMLRDEEALSYLTKIATAFLRENYDTIQGVNPNISVSSTMGAAPVENTLESWHRFLEGLARILSKVIGSTQASYVVARVLSEEGLSQMKDLPRDRYEEFGMHVIHQVPNKAKQKSLADEVKNLVQSI